MRKTTKTEVAKSTKVAKTTAKRSIENPKISLTANNVREFFGRTQNTVIDTESTIGIPEVYGAVKNLASMFAMIDVQIFKKSDKGGYKSAKKHPAYSLLLRSPDGNMLPSQFKSALLVQAIINGNGYARVIRDGINPVSLQLLDARSVTSYYNFYEIDYGNAHKEIVSHFDMLHLKGLSTDGITGIPIWEILQTTLGLSIHMRRYAESYFRNNCRINMVLQLTKAFPKQQDFDKFKEEFLSVHQGSNSAFNTAIVRDGAELKSLNQGGVDDTLYKLTEQQAKAIAVCCGIPVSFLGYADSYTSHNSLESQQKQLLMNCLNPWLIQMEEACEKVLLFEKEKETESHYIECNRSQLVSVDSEQEKLDIQKVINGLWGWEEYREKYNLPIDFSLTYFCQAQTIRLDNELEPLVPEPVQPPQDNTTNPDQTQNPDQKPNQKEVALRSKAIDKLINRIAKAVDCKGRSIDFEDHKEIFLNSLDCYENHKEVTDKFFENLRAEIDSISAVDLSKIDFGRYKEALQEGLK